MTPTSTFSSTSSRCLSSSALSVVLASEVVGGSLLASSSAGGGAERGGENVGDQNVGMPQRRYSSPEVWYLAEVCLSLVQVPFIVFCNFYSSDFGCIFYTVIC